MILEEIQLLFLIQFFLQIQQLDTEEVYLYFFLITINLSHLSLIN